MNSGIKISGKQIVALAFSACIGLFLLIAGCEKEKVVPREFPKLRTMEVSGINTDGALFEGIIEKAGSEEIIEWGFVWDINQNPKIETAEYYVESYSSGKNDLQRNVLSTLVAGEQYFVRFFARTASYVVYGNEVVFESLGSKGHISHDFNPKKGLIGSLVKISGEQFSKKISGGNIVKFDSVAATVIDANDTLVTVLVPEGLHNSNSVISVRVADKTDVLPGTFQLAGPEIASFSPLQGTIGDTVTIEGKNISIPDVSIIVKFNTFNAEVIEKGIDKLVVKVPPVSGFDNYTITVETGALKATAKEKFTILRPTITSVSPSLAMVGDTLNIQGTNFSWVKAQNTVKLDYYQNCTVVHATKNNLKVVVPPPGYKIIGSSRNPSALTVSIASILSYENYSFTYRAPIMEETPIVSATFHDTLTFSGTNLSYFEGEWKISINNINLPIVSLTDQKLKVVIPAKNLGNGAIDISTKHYNTQVYNSFRAPQITSISPATVTFGDEVKIACDYLNPDLSVNKVYLNDKQVSIMGGNNKELLFNLPGDIITNYGYIHVTVSTSDGQAFQTTLSNGLMLEMPEISNVSPLALSAENNRIIINGNGFNPDPNRMEITIGGYPFRVISAEPNQIIAEFPFENFPFNNSPNAWVDPVLIVCAGIYVRSLQDVRIDFPSPWKQKSSFPLDGVLNGTALSIGAKGYVVAGQSPYGHSDHQNVWEYDPASDEWTRKSDFPGDERSGAFGVSDNTMGYVGFGWAAQQFFKKDIWKYNAIQDSWTELPTFPGESRVGTIAFLYQDKLYVGGGFNDTSPLLDDFWRYDQAVGWSRLPDIPFFTNDSISYSGIQAIGSTIISNLGYSYISYLEEFPIGHKRSATNMLTYNFTNGTWQKSESTNINIGSLAPNASIGSKWFFIASHVYLCESGSNQKWSDITGWPGRDIGKGIAISINGKMYGGLGYYNDFWELDPSKIQ